MSRTPRFWPVTAKSLIAGSALPLASRQFSGLQAAEYYEAYVLYGLTLNSAFMVPPFMLTGFMVSCGDGHDHVADPAGPLREESTSPQLTALVLRRRAGIGISSMWCGCSFLFVTSCNRSRAPEGRCGALFVAAIPDKKCMVTKAA